MFPLAYRGCFLPLLTRLIRDTSEKPLSSSSGSNQGAHPVDPYDDRSAELMDVLAMIYFVVEVSRGDETFGDELSESSSSAITCAQS
jgi:hypothetical protein